MPDPGSPAAAAHRYALRVQWEDTDAAGIVYYANYLRFIERGRSDLLLQHGIDQHVLMQAAEDGSGGVAFAVRSCQIEYLKPARLHEELTVLTAITELRGASVTAQQDVWRGDEVLARATVKLACIDSKGRPTRVPRAIAAVFATLSPNFSR